MRMPDYLGGDGLEYDDCEDCPEPEYGNPGGDNLDYWLVVEE
jgi:hypothetical protein